MGAPAWMFASDAAPLAGVADQGPRLEAEVRRATVSQLLAGGPFVEWLHLPLVLLIAALVWNSLPIERTIGWVAAVTTAAGLRAWWRVRVRRRAPSPEEAVRGVRLTVSGVGLAWGFGTAVATPALELHEVVLALVVIAGLVAGATSTLVGDRRSFRYLLVTMLAPLPVGILVKGHARPEIIAIALIAIFAWGMDRVHASAHRTFTERIRATALLELSGEQLARQHGYLTTLLASAPVAIAIVDVEGRVRGVNPQCNALFGYATEEMIDRELDEADEAKVFSSLKEVYQRDMNLVWLEPFGFSDAGVLGGKGGKTPSVAAPVVRKDTLSKFPALPRVINKLSGKVDNGVMSKLIAEGGNGNTKKATRKFLKDNRLI